MKIEHPARGPNGEPIDGKLQIAVEDADENPTGEVVEFRIISGIMDVPDEHAPHVLRGLHGSRLAKES